MKKLALWMGAVLLCGLVVFLTGCVSPIGSDPDGIKIKIDTTVTQGDEDWRIKTVDSAVLMLINRSKTIDVTQVTITQPDNPDAATPVVTFPGKPVRLTKKAQYLQPSDISYVINIEYTDYNTNPGGTPGTAPAITMPLAKALEYPLYIFRNANGGVVVTPTPVEPADPDDTEDPPGQPPQSPDDGEGSVPGAVPSYNRGTMGVFVVMNMTKNQPVSKVEFEKRNGTELKAYSINTTDQTVFGAPTSVPAVKASDQRSIALGQGSWNTKLSYTVNLTTGGTEARTTEVRQSVVIPINDPQALRSNYLYFYKTSSGGYDVSFIWPPVSGYDPEGNVSIEDTLPDGWGILEVSNASESGTVVEKIKITGPGINEEHSIMMAKGDEPIRFPLPGDVYNVAFKPHLQTDYGFFLPRTINPGRVTKLVYYDYLGKTDVLPPAEGYGVGMIRIKNQSNSPVTSVDIINLDDINILTVGYDGFIPASTIQRGQTGKILVMGTVDFPVEPGPIYLVQITVETPTNIVIVERKVELKDRIVDIVINEDDLRDTKRYGSRVTVNNQTTMSSLISNIQVYNKDNPAETAGFSLSVGNGNSGSLYVLSSTGMPILQTARFAAKLTVWVNGRVGVIEKEFLEGDDLWSDSPDTHTRTITLVQSDLQPPLIDAFKSVERISGIPGSLASQVSYMSPNYHLITGGIINLNSYATVEPPDATKQSPINWSITDYGSMPSSGALNLTGGALTVTGLPNGYDGHTGAYPIQITGTIIDAVQNDPGDPKTPYSRTFTINLSFATTLVTDPVTAITLNTPFSMLPGDAENLAVKAGVSFNPATPYVNGLPITEYDLQWEIVTGAGNASLSNTNNRTITAILEETTVSVRARLPGAQNGGGADKLSNVITVTIGRAPPPLEFVVRVMHLTTTDYVREIAIGYVPLASLIIDPLADDNCDPKGDPSHLPHLAAGATIGQSGHTGIPWAFKADKPTTPDSSLVNKTGFKKYFTDLTYIDTSSMPKGGTAELTLPWLPDNWCYLIWFIEGDGVVRSYVHPGGSPPVRDNLLFIIHPKSVYDNRLMRWMGQKGSSTERKEVTATTADAQRVLPIGYNSNWNTTSIMKSQGVNNVLLHDADYMKR